MRPTDTAALLADTIRALSVDPCNRHFKGGSPDWFGPRLVGGFTVAQALVAAGRAVPMDRRAHSLHAYFLRPALAGPPISHTVTVLREGRSTSTLSVESSQQRQPVLAMFCSFSGDRAGRSYELALEPRAPGPETAASILAGPFEIADVGPTPPLPDGTRRSTRRAWIRVAGQLPDDPRLHTCLLTFISDMTWNAGRPWDLETPPDISTMRSVDHAIWFHRTARADQWLFYDLHSLVQADGRGLLRGTIRDERLQIVASMAQEMGVR